MDTAYSEDAREYRPEYKGLPRTPAEVRLHLEEIKAKKDAGMIGPVSALMEMETALNYEEAVAKLARAALEKGEVEAATNGLLQAGGLAATPVATAKPVAYVTAAAGLLAQAQAGEVPVESVAALLISGCGFTAAEAEGMVKNIKPRVQEAA
jgi:hypothetical protein